MKTYCLCLASLLACLFLQAQTIEGLTYSYGAVVRGDSTKKELALVFTADEYGEGLTSILKTLGAEKVKGSFFFTGRFYRNANFKKQILQLQKNGHYLGPHSDEHLLYCDWIKRDSLLVSSDSFARDLSNNISVMKGLNLPINSGHFFIPPYEWWNDSIAKWSKDLNFRLFNFTPGIRTAADYTWPELGATYKSSDWIINSLKEILNTNPQKLNGSIILIHAGTDPHRTDKLYDRMQEIIKMMKLKGFSFRRIDELIP